MSVKTNLNYFNYYWKYFTVKSEIETIGSEKPNYIFREQLLRNLGARKSNIISR